MKEIDETKYVYRVIYKWYQDHYEELSITELTDKEINDMNTLIDEIEVADLRNKYENKINKLNKFKFTSESLERYKTDLAEYSFMLEQQLKK